MRGIQLVITMTEDGRIKVDGPIDNKILCYGLLEAGRDIIKEHKIEEPRIVVPQMEFKP